MIVSRHLLLRISMIQISRTVGHKLLQTGEGRKTVQEVEESCFCSVAEGPEKGIVETIITSTKLILTGQTSSRSA